MKPTAPDLLAIDPGTKVMGLATFQGSGLLNAWDKHVAGDFLRERGPALLDYLADVLIAWPTLKIVVCERLTALDGRPVPAPLVATIEAMARLVRDSKLTWLEYHPSTVTASVRPRGMQGVPRKQVIELGIRLLYPHKWLHDPPLGQDVWDAVAVGHCHLSKQLAKAKEGTP